MVRSVTLKVTRTPRMIDVLFGMPQIVQFDAVLRFRYQRIWMMDEIEMVFVDFIQNMYARSQSRPLNVLSSCDGIATWAIMLRAAG